MALALRLNELAIANSEGLLNDDEYRLLRQNLFDQCSTTISTPVEVPLVPISRVQPTPRASAPSTNQRRTVTKSAPEPQRGPSVRVKSFTTTGVANLLRRATGRKSPAITDSSLRDIRKSSATPIPVQSTPKRSVLIPRLLQKKPIDLVLHTPATEALRPLSSPIPPEGLVISNPPLSPTGSIRRTVPNPEDSIPTIQDIFDDSNLVTAKDIRSAIAVTEDEAERLIDAFNNLEANVVRRINEQRAHRLPASTPTSINILLEGKEWREHRLVPSPSSPIFENKPRNPPTSFESNSDRLSIRSGSSSNTTTLSLSKSIPSFPKQVSPLSPHFRTPSVTLLRKSSMSSISSQGTTLTSAGLLGVNTTPTLSRSTSHLPLRRSSSNTAADSTDTILLTPITDIEDDPEVLDIQRRRNDLISRYTARLDFLRAKLKGAELHEKLLRK